MASTQHAPGLLPQATEEPFGACYQQSNPNPYTWTMRALLDALTRWVRDGTRSTLAKSFGQCRPLA